MDTICPCETADRIDITLFSINGKIYCYFNPLNTVFSFITFSMNSDKVDIFTNTYAA